MKVIMVKSCATRVGGKARSLPARSEQELPDDVAEKLVAAGVATAADAHESNRGKSKAKGLGRGRKPAAKEEEPAEEPSPEPEPEPEPEGKSLNAAPENK